MFLGLAQSDRETLLDQIENKDIADKFGIEPHGFCLACMINCHDGHEVNELYSKMDFRCDCGNSKMPLQCQLIEDKDDVNERNRYNDNYYDLYCHCRQPHDQEGIENQQVSHETREALFLIKSLIEL